MILAGDIGAEQTHLALYKHDKDAKGKIHLGQPKIEHPFTHTDYSGLKEIFADFFAKKEVEQVKTEIYAVCLSIAGPITGKCFDLHGAPWVEAEREFCKETLAKSLFCPVPILFLNDMEAIGYSIFTLPSEELATLDMVSLNEAASNGSAVEGEEIPRRALMLVVEGLGQALWYRDEKSGKYSPFSSEGGHTDFAARNDDEINLLKYLQSKSQDPKRSPISYEQVLSIGGLRKILAFVEERDKQSLSSAFKQDLEKQPKEKQIEMLTEAAIKGDVTCKKTWDLFLSILGAQAGNIALTYRAEEGVYLTGFVLVELVKQLLQKQVAIGTFFTSFLEAFSNKEKTFAGTNAKTSVNIVCKSKTVLAMTGAAQYVLPFVPKGFIEVNKKLAK